MLNEQGEGGSRECLVISSSRDSCKWVFPKGGWENDESLEEAARRETLEEAGVVVELRQNLGWFSTGASKSGEKEGQVCMFEAVCLEQLEHWAEGFRCRQWVHITG
jgi:diphosphoinositol-polyphosphate diphosphatase